MKRWRDGEKRIGRRFKGRKRGGGKMRWRWTKRGDEMERGEDGSTEKVRKLIAYSRRNRRRGWMEKKEAKERMKEQGTERSGIYGKELKRKVGRMDS